MESTIQNPVWLSIVLGICVGGPLVTLVLCRLFKTIEVTSKSYHEATFKKYLIDKGFSAEQIHQIFSEPGKGSHSGHRWQAILPGKPPTTVS